MDGTYYEIQIVDTNTSNKNSSNLLIKEILDKLDSNPHVEKVLNDSYAGLYRSKDKTPFENILWQYRSCRRYAITVYICEDGEVLRNIKHLKCTVRNSNQFEGEYSEMHVYDRKDYYAVKDPENKKLLQILNTDPDIVKDSPGVYRSKSAILYSLSRIYENSRWRMEVVEKKNEEIIVRSEPTAEVITSSLFVKIENRNIATYVWDLLISFLAIKTMFIYYYIPILCGLSLFVLGYLMINESTDPIIVIFGLPVFLVGIIIFPFATLFFTVSALYMPFKIYIHYKNKERIEFGE